LLFVDGREEKRRNPVPPPQLPRNTPRLDVLHPVEEGLFPRLGHDPDFAGLYRYNRLFRQFRRVHIPLIGQPRLDHHAAAVAEGGLDYARFGVVLHPFAILFGDVGDEETIGLEPLHHRLARVEPVKPDELRRDQSVRHLTHRRLGIEHIEHCASRKPGALADLKVVEIMARRDLHTARTQRRIGVFIGDDRDAPSGDRQDDMLANHAGIAFVRRVHRHRHIGQHRFGPGGGDDQVIRAVSRAHTIRQRITEPPEMPLNFAGFDLQIADRGFQLRIPVHQPFIAVDQPVIIQADEGFDYRLGEVRVHGELFTAPVHRTAQTAQLVGDGAAGFGFPFPHLGDEILAAVIGALVALRLQLAFDHHLRGNARMIGAHHPQRVFPAQAFIAHHHVLQRVVERVADMQAAGHIGRRVDDGEGLGVRPVRTEQGASGIRIERLPMRIPARLDIGRVESGGQSGGNCVGHDGPRHASTDAAMQSS